MNIQISKRGRIDIPYHYGFEPGDRLFATLEADGRQFEVSGFLTYGRAFTLPRTELYRIDSDHVKILDVRRDRL